ncbi:VOC family protein [Streptosporangium amethystogenes subsp. fukuiense]|uniref:VOC family protein n=1 Tax=Streptosporangium amethystogenes subsp. fukuiense TaxID=698418 RepID=A0ABW2SRD9_9ACTN
MRSEAFRDIAHVGSVELFTSVPEETRDFFVDLMAMKEVHREGDSIYLHSWDDYERYTVKVTGRDRAGVGRTFLRAARRPCGAGSRPSRRPASAPGGASDGEVAAIWYSVCDKSYDIVYTADRRGARGRLHHVAFATDTREDILRAADVFLEAGIHIETGPHKHAIQQTFFLYVWEPGGNRVELCNAGARLILAPDWEVVTWTQAERAKGQAWGLKTIDSFHTHGTPVIE